MPNIYVDEQVIAELKSRAPQQPPNNVVRQLLGLWVAEPQVAQPGVYLIPHSPKEFPGGASDLSQWLLNEVAKRPQGDYYVASLHYWRNIIPESTCIFHKDKIIIGEGRMVGGLTPYKGGKISPSTNVPYIAVVHFDPISITVYNKPISFSNAETLLGKTLTFRAVQRITSIDHSKILKACS